MAKQALCGFVKLRIALGGLQMFHDHSHCNTYRLPLYCLSFLQSILLNHSEECVMSANSGW